MNQIFYLCVDILRWLARVFGTTYQAVNVWIFVIIWPVFTLLLILGLISQNKKIKALRSTPADEKLEQ